MFISHNGKHGVDVDLDLWELIEMIVFMVDVVFSHKEKL